MQEESISMEQMNSISEKLKTKYESIKYISVFSCNPNMLQITYNEEVKTKDDFLKRTLEIESISQEYGYWVKEWKNSGSSNEYQYNVYLREITNEELNKRDK